MGPDGLPILRDPTEVGEIACYIVAPQAGDDRFDIVCAGMTTGTDRSRERDLVLCYAAASTTWWMESFDPERDPLAEARRRIGAGPPVV